VLFVPAIQQRRKLVAIIFAQRRETAIRNHYYDSGRDNYLTRKVSDLTDQHAENG
jgi:hypothetical protein